MRTQIHTFLCAAIMVTSFNVFAADCINCGSDDVLEMPKNSLFDSMEKSANAEMSAHDRLYKIKNYCVTFSVIPQELVGKTIKEMEQTPIPPEEFLTRPVCRVTGYSENIKTPMLHIIADDITKREEFLQNIWLYYSKKRKQPEIFNEAINAKNSDGETLLDYIENLRSRDKYIFEDQIKAMNKVIKMLCEHGGVYAVSKEKSCVK